MASALSHTVDKRPLKRRLAQAPDIYPQEKGQKEDELTPDKLLKGYQYTNPCHSGPMKNDKDEYEAAMNIPKYGLLQDRLEVYAGKMTTSFNGILAKKTRLNTWTEKKNEHKKDFFWHASANPRNKDQYFKEFAGNKPLSLILKKMGCPVLNKTTEIFHHLCDFNISPARAAWFIKMSVAYTAQQQNQARGRRPQQSDPSHDWTKNFRMILSETLTKLNEYYKLNSKTQLTSEVEGLQKQWLYFTRLARFMYDEGLLERDEFLEKMVDLLGKLSDVEKSFAENKICHDHNGILKIFLPFLLQFTDDFTLSEMLSRKLAFICCRRLQLLYLDWDSNLSPTSPGMGRTSNPLTCFNEYLQCNYHRIEVLGFSALIQAILVNCPTALVWNYLTESSLKEESVQKLGFHCGSPLDFLTCPPSALPIPEGLGTNEMRKVLRLCEADVVRRGQAVDMRWSSDKHQQSGLGTMVPILLSILEALDNYDLNKAGEIDALYGLVFTQEAKEIEEGGETTIVKLLCHWAVTDQRVGCHRPLMVVRLLEKRKQELSKEMNQHEGANGKYPFQQTLFNFLDQEAPQNGEGYSAKLEFQNLMLLFSELIRADLFSHDQYIRTLTARGELNSAEPICEDRPAQPVTTPAANQPLPTTYRQMSSNSFMGLKPDEHDFSDLMEEEPKVDLGKPLALLEGNLLDKPLFSSQTFDHNPLSVGSSAPGSVDITMPSSVESTPLDGGLNSSGGLRGNGMREETLSRHQKYVLHLRIPQNETFKHECNQRHTMLFGFGPGRENHKQGLKKLTKEMNKLWQKKSCYECTDGGGVKYKRKASADVFKALSGKFMELNLYDQNVVSGICLDNWIEQLQDFIHGYSTHLPAPESVDFLLGLLEHSYNIFGIVDFFDEVCEVLVNVERELRSKNSQLFGLYGFQISTCFIGFFRKHFPYFLLCPEETQNIFLRLCTMIDICKGVGGGSSSSSTCNNWWERTVWAFVHDLSVAWPDAQNSIEESFRKFQERLKKAFPPSQGSVKEISNANGKSDSSFLREYLDNPKRKLDPSLVEPMKAEGAANLRYSFVVNALSMIPIFCQEPEKLSDLSNMCADVSALCPSLAGEWLGALRALCSPAHDTGGQETGFNDLLLRFDVNDPSLHQPTAVFAMTLVSRHAVCLESLLTFTCVTVLKLWTSIKEGKNDTDMVAGVRLTLQILAAVFCLADRTPVMQTRLITDRYLICPSHQKLSDKVILFNLVPIILLVDSNSIRDPTAASVAIVPDERPPRELHQSKGPIHMLAAEVLKLICSQDWIKWRFINEISEEILFDSQFLLHNRVSLDQAQRLLRLLLRRRCERHLVAELENFKDKKELLGKIFSSSNLWNMRATLLDLRLLLKQAETQKQPVTQTPLPEIAAQACMELFYNQNGGSLSKSQPSQPGCSSDSVSGNGPQRSFFSIRDVTYYWLVAPLTSKLKNVQGKVLKVVAQVLDTGQLSRKDKSNGGARQSARLLRQQPLMCLVLTCLRGNEDEREKLLGTALKHLQDFVQRAKDDQEQIHQKEMAIEMHDMLLLWLSLVGGMFETVCKGQNMETWACLLFQLMLYGVVTLDKDSALYFTCLDMLCVLIHSCFVLSEPDISKKVIKKLKKEVGEHYWSSLHSLHQLLPIPRTMINIIACEPYGTKPPKVTKGNQPPAPPTPPPGSSRPGLQVSSKERLSPWDIIEGYKGWNWSWFQAVKVDNQLESVHSVLRRLMNHDHSHDGYIKRPSVACSDVPNPFLQPLQVQYDEAAMNRAAHQASLREQQQMEAAAAASGAQRQNSMQGMQHQQQHQMMHPQGHYQQPGHPQMNPGTSMANLVPDQMGNSQPGMSMLARPDYAAQMRYQQHQAAMSGHPHQGMMGMQPGMGGPPHPGHPPGPEYEMHNPSVSPRGKKRKTSSASRGRRGSRGGAAAAAASQPNPNVAVAPNQTMLRPGGPQMMPPGGTQFAGPPTPAWTQQGMRPPSQQSMGPGMQPGGVNTKQHLAKLLRNRSGGVPPNSGISQQEAYNMQMMQSQQRQMIQQEQQQFQRQMSAGPIPGPGGSYGAGGPQAQMVGMQAQGGMDMGGYGSGSVSRQMSMSQEGYQGQPRLMQQMSGPAGTGGPGGQFPGKPTPGMPTQFMQSQPPQRIQSQFSNQEQYQGY